MSQLFGINKETLETVIKKSLNPLDYQKYRVLLDILNCLEPIEDFYGPNLLDIERNVTEVALRATLSRTEVKLAVAKEAIQRFWKGVILVAVGFVLGFIFRSLI